MRQPLWIPRPITVPILVLSLACAAVAAAEQDLADVLARPILKPHQTTVEAQVFGGARVPVLGIPATAPEWTRDSDRLRKQALDIVLRGEAARWSAFQGRVEWLDTIEGPGYYVRKLRYEVIPGLWSPALLYEPRNLSGKAPVVLNLNGHGASGVGDPDVQQRCINLAKRGLLALNVEWFGFGQLAAPGFRHYAINQIDLCGTSGVALHFLSQRRALDILLAREHADSARVAVTGLSGGGWQTIFLSALDPRVTLSNPVAGYTSFVTRAQVPRNLGDSEQTPSDLAALLDYSHLTAMLAPRPLLLTNNAFDDCCFRADDTLPALLSSAAPVYRLYGAGGRLRYHINFDPGTHNYERDNRQAFYTFLRDFFFAGSPGFPVSDIPSSGEVRNVRQLRVPIPADNLDFQKIALALSRNLPPAAALPAAAAQAPAWQRAHREMLRRTVHLAGLRPRAEKIDGVVLQKPETTQASLWKLSMDDVWTVPLVELSRPGSLATTIVLADAGRASLRGEIDRLLAAHHRVIAVDPFYFGECRLDGRDYLMSLLIAAAGERPLGIQAGQVLAVSHWLAQRGEPSIGLAAYGPRTSLVATVAAALEPGAIANLTLQAAFGSLKEIIEQNLAADQAPELFCFGLLAQFDMKQLLALVAPRPLTIVQPSARAASELRGLADYYRLLGGDFTPLPMPR